MFLICVYDKHYLKMECQIEHRQRYKNAELGWTSNMEDYDEEKRFHENI